MKPIPVALLLLFLTFPALADTLTGRVVKIADGDTLTILIAGNEQKRIRLSEIDTPERGQPWSRKAKQALTDKVAQETIDVEVVTTDRYGRTVGKIWLGERDINRELVAEGHAWVYRKYMTDQTLLEDEGAPREARRGLWGLPEAERMPPWEWRRKY